MTFPRHGYADYRTLKGVTERFCTGCATWKPHDADHFHRNRAHVTGLQTHCKQCQRRDCGAHGHALWVRRKARYKAQREWWLPQAQPKV